MTIEEVLTHVNRRIAELTRARQLLQPGHTVKGTPLKAGTARNIPAASREKMAAAQHKRWAKFHRERARA